MVNNPYIEKVRAHPKIITKIEDAIKHKWKWHDYFWNNNPIVLEIGTGLGNFFSTECAKNLDKNYIGMEIKYKRVYNTAEKTIAKWGENFVVIKEFAQKITEIFGEWELELTYIFFPDPWGKKDRQKKHRIFQEEFITNLWNKTKTGWKVIFKTDHKEYFDDTLELLDKMNIWEQNRKTYHYEKDIEEFDVTNITEFEQIFRGDKLEICYIELTKK